MLKIVIKLCSHPYSSQNVKNQDSPSKFNLKLFSQRELMAFRITKSQSFNRTVIFKSSCLNQAFLYFISKVQAPFWHELEMYSYYF